MFAKLNLRNRMLIGYSIPIFTFIILGMLNYSGLQRRDVLEEKTQLSKTTLVEINETIYGLSRMVRNVRGKALFPQDNTYLKSYQDGLTTFRQISTDLKQLIKDPEQQARLNTIIAEGEALDKTAQQVFSLLQESKTPEAAALTQELRMAAIDEARDAMIKHEQAFLEAISQEQKANNLLLLLLSILGTLVATTFAIAVGIWLSSNIGRTIKTINKMAATVAISSTEIASTLEQQEQTVSEQASSINDTTITIEELGASSRQSAEQAEASAAGARQTLMLAENGTKTVQQTIQGITTLKDKVGAIAEQIMRLSEQTGQIATISDLVSDLANQTNMLALNAAVEAARAGENGRGFSIVAGEIRKLADQSKQSAEKIGTLIANIQASINATVMVTDEGTKTANQGIELTQATVETFASVSDAVNHVFVNSQQISLSSKQQAVAVQQVVGSMNSLNLGAGETASGISQIRVSTEQLKDAANHLKALG